MPVRTHFLRLSKFGRMPTVCANRTEIRSTKSRISAEGENGPYAPITGTVNRPAGVTKELKTRNPRATELTSTECYRVLSAFSQRPSVMALGRPFSQPMGVFHGREESSSDVAQPASTRTETPSSIKQKSRVIAAKYIMKRRGAQGLPGRPRSLRRSPSRASH